MMLERALSKLEKNGFDHDVTGQRGTATRPGSNSMIEFMMTQGSDSKEKTLVAVRTMNVGEQDDPARNKYVGTWYPNLSQAIRAIDMKDMQTQKSE